LWHEKEGDSWRETMTEEDFKALCEDKGYGDIKVKSYEPHGYDPMHTHDLSIIGLILEGQMTLEWEEGLTTYKPGDICEFAAGTLHAEKTGPKGAKIILGFK
jgi:quercetin dioxygenase-like cupin family protein